MSAQWPDSGDRFVNVVGLPLDLESERGKEFVQQLRSGTVMVPGAGLEPALRLREKGF